MPSQTRREIAPTIVVDTMGRLLLHLREDIPTILYPDRIGLFGGHREGDETFLDCAMREIAEELSIDLPAERFRPLAVSDGEDPEIPGMVVRAEFFVVTGIPVDSVVVTEGILVVIPPADISKIATKLTPSARFALDCFMGLSSTQG